MFTHTQGARALQRFKKNEDGGVAIIFGLTALIAFATTGLAIDVGRTIHAERKISAAVDAAALAAAKALSDGASEDRARQVVDDFFRENMKGSGQYAEFSGFNVTIDAAKNAVTIDLDASVKTLIGGVAGVERINFPKSATALYDTKDIEIGLQLDVTGSMNERNKLASLKDAVAGTGGLFDIMLSSSSTTTKIRIGLAPYAAGVNAGDYARAVSGNRATDGCVYERRNLADQDTELPPTGALALKARSDLSNEQACPSGAKVMPLSSDRDGLRREVNRWSANGSTAGHLGTAWAWYLVSPEWSAVWPDSARPANYNDGKTEKYAILMTDGIYNTVGGVNGGDVSTTATRSAQMAIETCTAMKDKGIIVYTVGFEAPNSAKTTLQSCASHYNPKDTASPKRFFDAKDGAALKDAFRAIADEIKSLRLTN